MAFITTAAKPPVLLFSAIAAVAGPLNLSTLLEQSGVQLSAFSDPKLFLSAVNVQSPTLSLIEASKTDEKLVLALIKAIRKVLGQVVPIFLVTPEGAEDTAFTQNVRDAGANGIITKPLELLELCKILTRFVVTDEIVAVIKKAQTTKIHDTAIKKVVARSEGLAEVVGWVFEKVFPVMASLSTSLESLDQVEARIQFYSERAVAFKDKFLTMVNGSRKGGGDEKLDLTQCIRFYGLGNMKYLTVADKLLEATRGAGIEWDENKNGLGEDPKKVISYAIKLLDHFGEDSLYRKAAFHSGLVFDLLAIFAEDLGDRKAEMKKEIEIASKNALQKAGRAVQKGKSLDKLPLARHIVTTFFLTEAGRLAMGIFYADYVVFMRGLATAKIPLDLVHIAEEAKYGINHVLLGALICQVTPGLGAAYQSVLFGAYPYMLAKNTEDAEAFTLAGIVHNEH